MGGGSSHEVSAGVSELCHKEKERIISVDLPFEIPNGLLGMMRDIILRLCHLMEMRPGINCERKDQIVRTVFIFITFFFFLMEFLHKIVGMSQQQFMWKTHTFFVSNRIHFTILFC
jgi:hypothetical protein